MKCGNCESTITVQEKFKKIIGQKELKSYVYYNCSKYNDHKCKESMIREDSLLLQLLEVIDLVDIDSISVSNSLKEEIQRYNIFQTQLLKKEKQDVVTLKQINIRNYMKYMICNGSKDEKRGILTMITDPLIFKDGKIHIQKLTEEVPKEASSGKKKGQPKKKDIN